jgi:hypothetical protein
MGLPLLRPILRPLTRFLIGVIAIPLFRLFLKRVVRLDQLDAELEKDLEQWFRGCLLLLVATRNMEETLFGWVDQLWQGDYHWMMMGFRILLAVGVVEAMPDQELFAIIHPGPPKLKLNRNYGYWRELREKCRPICVGLLCRHLDRSSAVFAILAAIAPGWIGWTCYALAITQYLIIGLVTSRDKALDALSVFDRQVAIRRRELVEEFNLSNREAAAGAAGQPNIAEIQPNALPACCDAVPELPSATVAKSPNAGYVSE